MACPPTPLCVYQAVVSGWGESDPRFAPLLMQRRVARWPRHKLADSKALQLLMLPVMLLVVVSRCFWVSSSRRGAGRWCRTPSTQNGHA